MRGTFSAQSDQGRAAARAAPESAVHSTLSVVPLDTLGLQQDATALYRSVFGYTGGEYALNPRLLRGLLINGGSAIGAIDADGHLVGFSYGYPGVDDGVIFHYSQATAVAPGFQGIGVGRLLKTAQAEIARATGATSMRWAFDPVIARNAHFNLDTLGARGRWFHTDFYGEPDSDRMIVDWPIVGQTGPSASAQASRARVAEAVGAGAAGPELTASGQRDGYQWLRFPAALTDAALPDAANARRAVRTAVAHACEQALTSGLAALSCRRPAGDAAVYLFGDEAA